MKKILIVLSLMLTLIITNCIYAEEKEIAFKDFEWGISMEEIIGSYHMIDGEVYDWSEEEQVFVIWKNYGTAKIFDPNNPNWRYDGKYYKKIENEDYLSCGVSCHNGNLLNWRKVSDYETRVYMDFVLDPDSDSYIFCKGKYLLDYPCIETYKDLKDKLTFLYGTPEELKEEKFSTIYYADYWVDNAGNTIVLMFFDIPEDSGLLESSKLEIEYTWGEAENIFEKIESNKVENGNFNGL